MSDKRTTNYRDKYLAALDDQERLEKQHAFQLDLLKKTLFQVGIAASGMDQGLDAAIIRLREVMRGGSGAQAVDQMDRVKTAVENFEQTRSKETTKTAKMMSLLIDQYMALQIPTDLRTSLKSFSKSLNKRLQNYRNYTLALEELAKLQQLALDSATNPKAGLWLRLKGGNTLAKRAEKESSQEPTQDKNSGQAVDNGPAENEGHSEDSIQSQVERKDSPKAADTSESEHELQSHTNGIEIDPKGLSNDEDSYTQVAQRIATTLASLVESIEPNDVVRHRVDIVRHRIERGMDWYVLAVTLEDIRDILFLRYLKADNEITDYLNVVRAELSDIRAELALAIEADENSNKAATTFSDQVSTGVDRIQNSVDKVKDINVLKQDVAGHLHYISDALKDFKARPSQVITDQLNELVDKVKSIEHESEAAKKALEEQRYKATHDNLTGLPNREAYIERVLMEHDRFNRYGHPLTMAICDIDFFKKINDGFGHQVGDKVLQLISKVVLKRLRNVDFIARYGGEEFVILLPETGVEPAYGVLDKIRNAVAKTPFKFKDKPLNITISFGIAEFKKDLKLDDVFANADAALYKAKEQGRNRCVISDK